MSDEYGDIEPLPPLPDDDEPVESVVSVHEQDDNEDLSQLGADEWTLYYCFTDYIEAIPLTAEIAGGDLEGAELSDFPETASSENYAMLYCLDCIDATHVVQINEEVAVEPLNYNNLKQGQVSARKALLANLLTEEAMRTVYILIGPNHDSFADFFQDFQGNDWAKIEVRPIPDDSEMLNVGDTLLDNLAPDCFDVMIAASSTVGMGNVTIAQLPDVKISPLEQNWLSEVVSFNHIPDVGVDDPPPDDDPQTPPVPIFPFDSFEATVAEFPPSELGARIVYATPNDTTERFDYVEEGYWVHQGTGYFTIPNGNCWVDSEGGFYRLYADDVAAPSIIGFFQLDSSIEIPPQSPAFVAPDGYQFPDIPVWGEDALDVPIPVAVEAY